MKRTESEHHLDVSPRGRGRPVPVEFHQDLGYAVPVIVKTSHRHDSRAAERCDANNCTRPAEVIRDGGRWCSWHWAEHQFTLRGIWINPTAKAG